MKLIENLQNGKITRQNLDEHISKKFDLCDKFKLLLNCKINNRADIFETVFWTFPPDDYESNLALSRWAILEPWHFEHEEIISSFQETYTKEKHNFLYIKSAILNTPDYLKNAALRDSYLRKCFYALAAQEGDSTVQIIQEFTAHNDNTIRKYANEQLNKLNDV